MHTLCTLPPPLSPHPSPSPSELQGGCLADMLPEPVTGSPYSHCLQTFRKTPDSAHCHTPSKAALAFTKNERVIVSLQDGSGWAVAMGTVAIAMQDGVIRLSLDKAVSCDQVCRIDHAPSFSGGLMMNNLTQLCGSDSERCAIYRLA